MKEAMLIGFAKEVRIDNVREVNFLTIENGVLGLRTFHTYFTEHEGEEETKCKMFPHAPLTEAVAFNPCKEGGVPMKFEESSTTKLFYREDSDKSLFGICLVAPRDYDDNDDCHRDFVTYDRSLFDFNVICAVRNKSK